MPSLKQLSDAVEAYLSEHPTELVTVVVDATFGHRIEPREVAEFEEAIEHNELVTPPAGAVGRGDAFILAIANKVDAIILSNDSFQEFHGDYPWLFDEGRLVGGKPVPHVGWVFVERVPVRGPLSRKSTRQARQKDVPRDAVRTSSASLKPMPVPKAPPPRVTPTRSDAAPEGDRSRRQPAASGTPQGAVSPRSAPPAAPARNSMVNDLMPFLEFVEKYPVGTLLDVVVETYSSHGAYVAAGGARAYLPLRNIADPAPRSARELFKIGETVNLQVAAFHAARRGIDLAIPGVVAGLTAPATAAKTARGRTKKSVEPQTSIAADTAATAIESDPASPVHPVESNPAAKPPRRGRAGATGAPAAGVPQETTPQETTPQAATAASVVAEPAPRRSPGRRRPASTPAAPDEVVSSGARRRRSPREAPAASSAGAVDAPSDPAVQADPHVAADRPVEALPSPAVRRRTKAGSPAVADIVAAVATPSRATPGEAATPARRSKRSTPTTEATAVPLVAVAAPASPPKRAARRPAAQASADQPKVASVAADPPAAEPATPVKRTRRKS